NYGSNAAGNAGGDPNEAAAWVNYANNIKHYGVKYWEVGNEVYGNGEYGADWEEDLHSDHSPTAYGSNVVTFAAAMKAQDPTVQVGAVLTAPGNWPDGQSPDWNSGVLAACGGKIDFVVVHWYPQGPGSESDAGLLGSTGQIAGMVSQLRARINQYCGANASHIQIFVTETNSVSYNPGKQTVRLVNGLFAADDVIQWLENGVANVDWWDLHNGVSYNNNSGSLYGTANYGDYGLLSTGQSPEPAADTPFPPYYGLQMLSHLGGPGDRFVSATSSQPLLSAYAVKQAGGNLALLLINKDPNNAYAAAISVSGYAPAGQATAYFYGENSGAITSSSVPAGPNFTVTAPPYSLTTIVMAPSGAAPPPTPTPAPPPPAPSPTYQVTYTVTNQWPGGFTANVTIQNNGPAINGWTLTWTFPGDQRITNLWNGVYTQTGPNVSVSNASYNAVIPTGGSVSFGFQGTFGSSNANPTAFTLNGASSGSPAPPPTPAPPPAFSATATATPSTVTPGGTSTLQVRVTDTGGPASGGIVDIEVYNSVGSKVS
ncbi:MAG: cellulose binding domain-containing protein, partial [Armatimonadetes bacterium]|nr:cellulose binding domain-containing protein [Armatimonadota bacterium]